MNKKLFSKNLVLFVLLTLVLSGCIFGGGKDQTVQEYLASVGPAITSLEANKIADLIAFPIVITSYIYDYEKEYDEEPVVSTFEIELKKVDFIENASEVLAGIKDREFELKVKIDDPEEGEIEITGGDGKEATVENAALYITLKITEEEAKQTLIGIQESILEILMDYLENADIDEEVKATYIKELQEQKDELEEDWEDMLQDILEDLEVEEWPGEFELELPLIPLQLTKQGSKWKLDVEAIFDYLSSLE